MDIEKVRTGSYALVLEQIDREIEKLRQKQDQNVFDIKVKNLSDSYAGGLLTTMEFVNQLQDVIARHPEEHKSLQEADNLLLVLCNVRHIILTIS